MTKFINGGLASIVLLFGCCFNFIAFASQWEKRTSQLCPEICLCTEIVTTTILQRDVVCRGTITDLKIMRFPTDIHFLDLSDTSLETIPEFYFMDQGLTGIIDIDLSNNQLSHIYFDMFIGLNKLKYLDLSYNKIITFDPNSLSYNEELSHLSLKGTSFPILADAPILISKSLQYLDISYCGLRKLPMYSLFDIPNLMVLNVSWNPLEEINVRVFENMQLRELDIRRTYIKCNSHFADLSEWAKQNSIKMSGYPCRNSHQEVLPRFISSRRRPSTIPLNTDIEWVTPKLTEDDNGREESAREELDLNADVELLTTRRPGEMDEVTVSDVEVPPEDVDQPRLYQRFWNVIMEQVDLTAALLAVFGLMLVVGISVCCVFAVCCRCDRTREEPNDDVSAIDEFQLVRPPSNRYRDPPPSYSSLFASKYKKVLPTSPRWAR